MHAYLTAEEVAERLRVSVSWVYKHKETLSAVRLGPRLWRFPENALETRLSTRQQSRPPKAPDPAARWVRPPSGPTARRWRVS